MIPAGAPAVLAVDIGGTKLAVGVVDRSGVLYNRRSAATPRSSDPEEVWAALAGLVSAVLEAAGDNQLAGCGVGCGGPMGPRGEVVSPLNIAAWRNFALRSRLAEVAGLATWVDNDAKALALAEGWRGRAAGRRNYLSLVVSTGVGGGIVADGRLLDGDSGNAGHIGHVVVVPGGRACACGGAGCLEAEASGTSIQAMTGRPAADAGPETVERTGRLVGRAVAGAANLLDLKLATVAGSVALGFGAPFFEAAQAEIDRAARLDFSVGCRILPSGLGDEGPLVGAGAVAWRGLGVEAP